MRKLLACLVLALPLIPLGHGCHREDDDIRTRWPIIWAVAGMLGGAAFTLGLGLRRTVEQKATNRRKTPDAGEGTVCPWVAVVPGIRDMPGRQSRLAA